MRILAIDSASVSGSTAIWQDGARIAESTLRCGLTHSETLLPQIEQQLKLTGFTPQSFDCVAVTRGPGSFTGLRIGMAAAKGFALSADVPVCGVSTLETIAWGLCFTGADICAVMDARREQVYNAWFSSSEDELVRITEDCACAVSDLEKCRKPTFLTGDGAEMCYNMLSDSLLSLAPEHLRYSAAFSAACLAALRKEQWQSPELLVPEYLRMPQAERERTKI